MIEKLKSKNTLAHRCLSAIFYGVGGAVGSRLLMLAANILLSRTLGQEIFGQFSSVSNTVNLFVTFSGVGISATLTRYVAASRQDGRTTGMYIRTLGSICCVLSLLLSLTLFVFSRPISVLSTGVETLSPYFKLVSLAIFFASMAAVEQSILVGFEQFRASSVIQLIRCAVYCGLGYLFSRWYGMYGAALVLLLSQMVQYFLYFLRNRRYYAVHRVELSWQWNQQTQEAAFRYAVPAFLSGLFVMPVHWIANAMLTRTAGFTEMALFSVANQWMTYITYIPAQMGQMRPIYTDLYVHHRLAELKKMVFKITVLTTGAAAAAAAVVSLGSTFLLSFYGEGYTTGRTVLILMAWAAVLYTAQVQTGFVMHAMKKMWVSAAMNGIWGIVLLLAYAFLLPYGSEGYAVAFCISYGVTCLLQGALLLRYLGKNKNNICETNG